MQGGMSKWIVCINYVVPLGWGESGRPQLFYVLLGLKH